MLTGYTRNRHFTLNTFLMQRILEMASNVFQGLFNGVRKWNIPQEKLWREDLCSLLECCQLYICLIFMAAIVLKKETKTKLHDNPAR